MSAGEIAVLGGGKLAQAMVELLTRASGSVRLWARQRAVAQRIAKRHAGVRVCATVEEACADARVIAFAVPASAVAEVAAQYGPVASADQIVLHACRGVAEGFVLPHRAIRGECCVRKIGVLGGPLYMEDLAPNRPLVAVLASRFDEVFEVGSEMAQGTPLRLHPSRDVVGVEVAGAVSNVARIAAGIAEGLGLGDTAAGVLLTRGLAEASRLGTALGAEAATFWGLAGVGDLIPRPVTSVRRHRELGVRIGKGEPASALIAEGLADEGVLSAREAHRLALRLGLSLPLLAATHAVLHEGGEPRACIEEVLQQDLELGA